MSWTPTFLIKKEEFDKNYPKISDKINKYRGDRRVIYSKIKDLIKEKKDIFLKNARELGVNVDEEDVKKKVEEKVEDSAEVKKLWNNLNDNYASLSELLEYYPYEDEDYYELDGNKYYIFVPEFSSQAYALKEFCEKNKIKFSTAKY